LPLLKFQPSYNKIFVLGKAIPAHTWTDLEGSKSLRLPVFQDNRHMKVLRFSALRTDRLYAPEDIPATHFCQKLNIPQGHCAALRIKSMKNSNDTIGNGTCEHPACSAVRRRVTPDICFELR